MFKKLNYYEVKYDQCHWSNIGESMALTERKR